jgi:hypothetical protein
LQKKPWNSTVETFKDGVFGLSPISGDDAMKVLRFELMVNVVCSETATSIRKGSAA